MSETPIADQVAKDLGTEEWVDGAEGPEDSAPEVESSDETAAA